MILSDSLSHKIVMAKFMLYKSVQNPAYVLHKERSKNEVTGKLKAVAYDKIDQQTDALISMIGENQVNYRFFIGFKLLLNDQEFSMKSLTVEAKMLCLILSMM